MRADWGQVVIAQPPSRPEARTRLGSQTASELGAHRAQWPGDESLVLEDDPQDRGTGQAGVRRASAHVAPRLRLQARQRWRRHPRAATLPWPPQHRAYGAIYRASLRPLRWILEGLRERMSDETDATGERRRRWRLGSVAARFLRIGSPWATLRLPQGIQSAPTVGDVCATATAPA